MIPPKYTAIIYERCEQAEEENEMSLIEGEILEDIVQADENWWSGTGSGGRSGLFPGLLILLFQKAS